MVVPFAREKVRCAQGTRTCTSVCVPPLAQDFHTVPDTHDVEYYIRSREPPCAHCIRAFTGSVCPAVLRRVRHTNPESQCRSRSSFFFFPLTEGRNPHPTLTPQTLSWADYPKARLDASRQSRGVSASCVRTTLLKSVWKLDPLNPLST